MEQNEVCAVVATYNRKELVKICINKILSQKNARCDIVVIDNGSSDGTEELFLTELALNNLTYFNTGKNLGSAGAQAIGIEKAVSAGYRYIWLMDDDVFPADDALSELISAGDSLEDEWGILSSVAYWTDGSICEANRQKKTLFTFLNKNDYKKNKIKVCMVSAASMFIKAEAVKKVGLPISEYFFYTDDYEFSSRVGKIYPIYVIPASRVTHAMKANMKADIVNDSLDRMYRYERLYRNDVHCYRLFGMTGYIYLFAKFVYTFLRVFLKEKKHKRKKIKILLNGYKDGLRFNPTVEMVEGTDVLHKTTLS